ncbi:hypothetical protein PIB30_111351 [Stylosanthes scabra]|uniref:Replication protein A 70 kDa DNA-binding subunit B/D first OB fold domain-containing protein n=2 Tax=Stylosanthes scabra TaxID=79078 RepID=A0ABU6T1C4_9FABA|nr:hypothetical protein [Stylosanthes scabra]
MEPEGVDRVADIKPTKLEWNLVVGVARIYRMPCQWISKDAYSMELVLQDKHGDRILCSIPCESVSIYECLMKENRTYSMSNFIVKVHRSGLKVTSHKYKLGVFLKTNARILSDDVFPFSPFRFTPFREIDEMCASNNIFLIDCIGQVVGKESPENIVTKSGQSSKRLRLYLEDVELSSPKFFVSSVLL